MITQPEKAISSNALTVSVPRLLRTEADAFQILARALPEMIGARAARRSIVPRKGHQMGDITAKVADHLGVEICSIFLFDADRSPPSLVLAEAFGYEVTAVGETKALNRGLTAMIFGSWSPDGQPETPMEMICNFNVQDHKGWTGQLDNRLRGHGWTLLAVPIVGANGKPKGVIKLENKRSSSHSDQVSTFLGATADKVNTPQEIRRQLKSLTDQVRRKPSGVRRTKSDNKLLDEIDQISEQLHKACDAFSGDLAFVVGAHEPASLDKLDEAMQSSVTHSLELQTSALLTSLEHLSRFKVSKQKVFLTDIAAVRGVLGAFALALRAYTPFSRTDVLLVRAVAALIAAAIDISESTSEAALHQLQHGLKNETAIFLGCISRLSKSTEAFWKKNDSVRDLLKRIFVSALNISGPNDTMGPTDANSDSASVTYRVFASAELRNRCLIYSGCARLAKKEFTYPQVGNIALEKFADKFVMCNTALIVGVCDILFCNAIEHGGQRVELKFEEHPNSVIISFKDNGQGFNADDILDLSQSASSESQRGRFGLKAAKHALEQRGLTLHIPLKPANRARKEWTRVAIEIPLADHRK